MSVTGELYGGADKERFVATHSQPRATFGEEVA